MNADQWMISDAIIDKVMFLFWEKGYFSTSIHDLVSVTGINRTAIYRHLGGKQGLFHLMLQRFRSKVVIDAVMPLTNPELGMEGIKQFFHQFTHCHLDIATSHACFMLAVAAKLPQDEPEAVRVIEEFIHHLRALFYRNLRWQQSEKMLDAELSTEKTADFLAVNVVGLMTMLRSTDDQPMLENHISAILHFISTLPVRKPVMHHNLHLIS